MAEPGRVLVTGASGYIGGSVLFQLTSSENKHVVDASISALVPGKDKAAVLESEGVKTVLFDDLDATDQLKRFASDFDVIISCKSGYHPLSAKALVEGLGTSGTSNLGDYPITGAYREDHIFSDKENIYAYEKTRNEEQNYAQREADLIVVQTGLETGVKTHVIQSPTIYGLGTGLFNRISIQIPSMIRAMIKLKRAEVIGDGRGEWDHVHIADLVELYEIVLVKILAGEEVPHGETGFLFSETDRHTWMDVAKGIADALSSCGIADSDEVRSVSLEEAARTWASLGAEDTVLAELGFASNSRTRSDVSRSLGWTPKKSESDFKDHFLIETQEILKEGNS